MKFLMFTPAFKKSSIGSRAVNITKALLEQSHEVTVISTESDSLPTQEFHDFGAQVIRWNEQQKISEKITEDTISIYQIGDNLDFHEGGLYWLSILPGIVCLHDFYLGNLFFGWARNRHEKAKNILSYWYESNTAANFFSHSDSKSFIEATHKNSPMTEWICSQALGVITHSSWGCDRVLKSCPGPVLVVPMAFDPPKETQTLSNTKESHENKNINLLTIGHANPNKRLESVIEAIGSNPILKEKVIYRSVGYASDETKEDLIALASKLGVNFTISGEVSDSELAQAINSCDIVSCLRWPTLEAASGSAIESMLYGKPIIVTNIGFYSEIPDEYVFKVSIENEINDIANALLYSVENRNELFKLGEKAKGWAKNTFNSENYATQIVSLSKELFKISPITKSVEYFTEILESWSTSVRVIENSKTIYPLKIFEF